MCLAQGPQRSDAGEALTRGPSVSSQALYHWATALPPLWFVIEYLWYSTLTRENNRFLNVLVKSNFATRTPFGSVSCFVVGICLSYCNLNSFIIHQAPYSKGCQWYLIHREILRSIWKIGRYPIKVSEVLEEWRAQYLPSSVLWLVGHSIQIVACSRLSEDNHGRTLNLLALRLRLAWTFLVLQKQQNLGRRFGTSKMHLSPPLA